MVGVNKTTANVMHDTPQVAERCMWRAKDLSGLLLLYSAKGSASGMKKLVELSKEQGKQNVAFLGLFLLGQLDECVDLLISSGRTPEAAFFARTYIPSRMTEVSCPPPPLPWPLPLAPVLFWTGCRWNAWVPVLPLLY